MGLVYPRLRRLLRRLKEEVKAADAAWGEKQIEKGNLDWTLKKLTFDSNKNSNSDLTRSEQDSLKDLELFQKYMNKIICNLGGKVLTSEIFNKSTHVIAEGILSKIEIIVNILRRINDPKTH